MLRARVLEAQKQLQNTCPDDSQPILHSSHKLLPTIPLLLRLDNVGRMFLHTLHAKCFTLFGICKPHNTFQSDVILLLSELDPESACSLVSIAIL